MKDSRRQVARALAAALKKMRLARGLSQEDLADRAGVHRTYVSQLERGLKSPTVDAVFRICRALDCSVADFMREVERGAR